jgi:hypothetical protein
LDRPASTRSSKRDRHDHPRWHVVETGERGGHAYSYSAGVKSAGTIGIDLSVVRSYNAEARLAYHVDAKKQICGNNDVPSLAGKIQEKSYLGTG